MRSGSERANYCLSNVEKDTNILHILGEFYIFILRASS